MDGQPRYKWQDLLEYNRLSTFDDIWNLQAEWFDEPNRRGKAWSGVVRIVLTDSSANEIPIFIKRQSDYVTRTWRSPFFGELTLKKEFRNNVRYQRLGIPTALPIYFSERKVGKTRQAILIFAELTGFISLDSVLRTECYRKNYRAISGAVCKYLCLLNRKNICHRNFYPKHIFFKLDTIEKPCSDIEVRVIDLENSKIALSRSSAFLHDLDTLNRRTPEVSDAIRIRFLLNCLQRGGYRSKAKNFFRLLQFKYKKKHH